MPDPEDDDAIITVADLCQVVTTVNEGFQDTIQKTLLQNRSKPREVDPGKLGEVDGVKWTTFKNNFKRIRVINKWEDSYAISRLPICFTDQAARAVEHIDVSTVGTLRALFILYDTIFINPASTKLFKVQFDQLSRNQGEDLLAYHTRIREIYIKAYPNDNLIEQSDILKDRFCLHLGSLSLSKALNSLVEYDTLTYTELLTRAQSIGASDLLCRTAYAKRAINSLDFEGSEMEALALDEPSIANLGFKFPAPTLPTTTSSSYSGHTRLTCHHCNKQGHISPNCPDILSALDRVRRNPSGYGFPDGFYFPDSVKTNTGQPSRGRGTQRGRSRSRQRGTRGTRGRGRGYTPRVNAMDMDQEQDQEDHEEDFYPLADEDALGN